MSYNNLTIPSNIAYGEITDPLAITKTAVKSTYSTTGEVIAYVITLKNSGATAVTGITVTDTLGAYADGAATRYPLTYVAGTLRYLENGTAQATPTIASTEPLRITGISVPAGGITTIAFHTVTNDFARFGTADYIENTATAASSAGSITATERITTADAPVLAIEKSISPASVVASGAITYTLRIVNSGNAAADEDAQIVVSDDFDPILSGITVALNGTSWTGDVTKYAYDEATGEFATVAGAVTVPAATYTVDPVTGRTIVTNGVSVLTITGTI